MKPGRTKAATDQQERMAMEAVARGFSATWEEGSNFSNATLIVAGKRVGVEIVKLKHGGTGKVSAAKARLRFDKVAIWLMERLRASVGESAAKGVTVLLTITAPILLPSKTAATLEEKIQALLGRGSRSRDEKDTIYGNRVHIRLLRDKSERAPKLIAFVHNPDSNALVLLDVSSELLGLVSADGGRKSAPVARDRWLVVISAAGISYLAAYRSLYSQLRIKADFQKILIVFGNGQVEELKA